jgi:DNA-binding IclR family transcriptional regulator
MMTIDAAARQQAQGTSFAKGLSVLAWLLDHGSARADEIAPAVDLPLSSVYRFLRTLREQGFVADEDGIYDTGPRLRDVGPVPLSSSIGTLAAPYLEHLSAVTGETAVLTVRQGLHAVCVSQVESAHQIRLAFELGQLLPLYAGAGQRVLLAFAPEEVQRAVLQGDIRARTPNTPTRAELTRVLARIRADGYALSRGELYAASVAIAMPVLHGDHAVAGVCVAGPQNRCTMAWRDTARRELAAAVKSMTASLRDAQQ